MTFRDFGGGWGAAIGRDLRLRVVASFRRGGVRGNPVGTTAYQAGGVNPCRKKRFANEYFFANFAAELNLSLTQKVAFATWIQQV